MIYDWLTHCNSATSDDRMRVCNTSRIHSLSASLATWPAESDRQSVVGSDGVRLNVYICSSPDHVSMQFWSYIRRRHLMQHQALRLDAALEAAGRKFWRSQRAWTIRLSTCLNAIVLYITVKYRRRSCHIIMGMWLFGIRVQCRCVNRFI
jgi:hypothetical protein